MKLLLSALVALSFLGASSAADPAVVMETSMGNIKIELFEDKAPVTVKNFLAYVDDKHYDGTIFHRVMKDFVIQGGGWMPDGNASLGMKEKPTKPPIVSEAANGVKNQKYTIAMARTANPNSATSQFYINVNDNSKLDKEFAADKVGYCVFGKVIEGMDIVEKIRAVKTQRKNEEHTNVPVETVTVKSIKRHDGKPMEEKKPDEKEPDEKKPDEKKPPLE